MEFETFIRALLSQERERFWTENDPVAKQRLYEWISAIERAPQFVDAVQLSIDSAEVCMNQAGDAEEMQRISGEWSALEWLQGVIRRARAG